MKGLIVALFMSVQALAQDTVRTRDTLVAAAPMQVQLYLDRGLLGALDEMWTVAANAGAETVQCVLGFVSSNGEAWADQIFQPKIVTANLNEVTAEACPYSVVMEWHPHLPDNPPEFPPTKRCFMSIQDQRNVLREGRVGLFHMVHAAPGMYCWWSYQQVMEHIRVTQFKRVLLPARGQVSW